MVKSKKAIVSKVPGGVQLFHGGRGEVQLLIPLGPIETHITCDFPVESGPPVPPPPPLSGPVYE